MTAQTILPANTLSGGYDVDNSLRFNSGSSDSLTLSTTAGNRTTWTFSTWFKRSKLGVLQSILEHDDTNYFRVRITSGDVLEVFDSNGNNTWSWHPLLRDISAWYHIVIRGDSTDGTNGNRLRLYINGTLASANAVASIDQNYTFSFNQGGTLQIGKRGSTDYLDGYLAETILIDGSALAPDQFGEFDEDSPTIWKPINVSGLTFGNQGLYLEFKGSGTSANSSGLGADTSGNDHHFTVNNLTAIDQCTDTCTNNFCTLNPLDNSTSVAFTLTEGNLVLGDIGSGDNDHGLRGTFGVNAGKWYYEVKRLEAGGTTGVAGSEVDLIFDLENESAGPHHLIGSNGTGSSLVYWNDGNFTNNASLQGFAANAIIGVALDMDNGKLFYSINGTFKGFDNNASDPAAGTNANFTDIPTDGTLMMPYVGKRGTANPSDQFNFGNPSFSVSSGNTDGNGFGNFEYAPPSGFFSLCTKNLANHG